MAPVSLCWSGWLVAWRSTRQGDLVSGPASGRYTRRYRAAGPSLGSGPRGETEDPCLADAPTSFADQTVPIAELHQNRSRTPQNPSFNSGSTLPQASLNALAKLSSSATFANATAHETSVWQTRYSVKPTRLCPWGTGGKRWQRTTTRQNDALDPAIGASV
jgi:hypothetical protein